MPQPDVPFPGDADPGWPSFAAALAGMVDRPYLASQRFQKQHWAAVRLGAHPDLLEFEKVMVARMTKLGVPVFVPEMVRTAKRQNELFALGNSLAKGGQSAHQYGCALDLVHAVRAWNLVPRQWELLHHVGEELIKQKGLRVENFCAQGLAGFDPAHWQIKDWKTARVGYPFKSEE